MTAAPQSSPDRRWWWSGTEWITAARKAELDAAAGSAYFVTAPAARPVGYPAPIGYQPLAYGPPPFGYQPPVGYQPPMSYGYQSSPAASTSGLAVASLVVSLVWFWGVTSLLAVIFGHLARRRLRQTGQRGNGIAAAGLILGYLGLVGTVVLIVGAITVANSQHSFVVR
jgi:hypothetical protein